LFLLSALTVNLTLITSRHFTLKKFRQEYKKSSLAAIIQHKFACINGIGEMALQMPLYIMNEQCNNQQPPVRGTGN
jgi:hypothetical protein